MIAKALTIEQSLFYRSLSSYATKELLITPKCNASFYSRQLEFPHKLIILFALLTSAHMQTMSEAHVISSG